ncbi:MAG: 50S ribosomal protein L15 [Planctomycetaceae bacterium]|nr:50S ribosomal protein L15 [Planctomycetaceae bacterium]
MNLNDVHRGIQRNKSRKRVGRGIGSGHGKTATRGHKGQGSRSGSSTSPIFEGGQMPLVRRIPKRGFTNRWAETIAIINLDSMEKYFQSGEEVSPESLRGKGLLKGSFDLVKVLGDGDLTKALKISAHKFSRSATEKIEKAGGQAIVLPGKKPVVKNKMKAKTGRS